jgi:hypothetical protein
MRLLHNLRRSRLLIVQKIVNYLVFYLIWCLCVRGAVSHHAAFPLSMLAFYLVFHLFIISESPVNEIILIAAVTFIGCFNESLLSFYGLVLYSGAFFLGISWWTIALYMSFATTLWYSFSWLIHIPFLGALLSAVVMPFCYFGLEKVGAISFPVKGNLPYVIIGVHYLFLFPVYSYIAVMLEPKVSRNI